MSLNKQQSVINYNVVRRMKGCREGRRSSSLEWEKGGNGSIPHSDEVYRACGRERRSNRDIIRFYEKRVANSRNDNTVIGTILRELAVPLEMRMEALRENYQLRSWYQQGLTNVRRWKIKSKRIDNKWNKQGCNLLGL